MKAAELEDELSSGTTTTRMHPETKRLAAERCARAMQVVEE